VYFETRQAFNSRFDAVNLHRPTITAPHLTPPPVTAKAAAAERPGRKLNSKSKLESSLS
jgi:hypothetical protein